MNWKEMYCKNFNFNAVFFLEIINKCNLNCEYCYFKNNISFNEKSIKYIEFVFDKLSNLSCNIKLFLLGGEPSLHSKFFDIIKLSKKFLNKKIKSKILIQSNGINYNIFKNLSFNEDHNFDLNFNFSYHFSQLKRFKKDLFFKSINILKEKNYKVVVSLLLLDDIQLYKTYHEIINRLLKNNIDLSVSLIFDDFGNLTNFSKRFYQEFSYLKKYLNKSIIISNDFYNKKEIDILTFFENKYNILPKNILCNGKLFDIKDFQIINRCFGNKYNLLFDNLNILCNKNLKLCNHNECNCFSQICQYKRGKK